MPTYDFKCNDCQHRFEEFLSIKSSQVQKCPICGRPARRLISKGGGLLFKGGGFYVTDYRKPDYKEKAKADSH